MTISRVDAAAATTSTGGYGVRAFKLFLSHILIALFFFNVWTVGYPGRIVYLAKAIVEHKTFSLSNYVGDPIFEQYAGMDAMEFNGRVLNPHNPGTSFLATLGVWIYEATLEAGMEDNPLLDYYLLSVFAGLTSTVVLYAASVACIYLVLRSSLRSERRAMFFALVYSLCTPVFFYASRNCEDSSITSLFVLSFSFLFFARSSHPKYKPWLLGISGLCLGYACLAKMPAFIGLPFFCFLFVTGKYYRCTDGRMTKLCFVLFVFGLTIPIAALLAYQWRVYGVPFANPISIYGTVRLVPEDTSILSVRLRGLAQCLSDLRCYTYYTIEPAYGLFVNSPVLFLGPLGYLKSRLANKNIRGISPAAGSAVSNLERLSMALIVLVYFVWQASLTTYGTSPEFGSRYALPSVPFLVILAALYSHHFSRSAVAAVASVSGLFAYCSTLLGTGNSFLELKILYPVTYFGLKGPFSPLIRSLLGASTVDIQDISGMGATLLMLFLLAMIWVSEITNKLLSTHPHRGAWFEPKRS